MKNYLDINIVNYRRFLQMQGTMAAAAQAAAKTAAKLNLFFLLISKEKTS